MEQMRRLFKQQNQQRQAAVAAASAASLASAIPPCTIAKNNYTAAKITMANTTSAYETCSKENPSQYPAPDQILQPIPDPVTQRKTIANTLQTKFNDQVALYTSLLSSTKALIAATQPLNDYKTILTNQLESTNKENTSLLQKIQTYSNVINQTSSSIPELSNRGPFGATNLQNGVAYSFLSLYSLFFISLSAVLYLQFKNTVSPYLLITGIVLMIVLAAMGAYFCAISKYYGLGL
jgi:hypothetical protein